jgi:hypothetical protein
MLWTGPSRAEAREYIDALRSRIQGISDQSTRTEFALDTRPDGLECWVGDRYLGKAPFTLALSALRPGRHVVRIVDARGFVSQHEIVLNKGVQAKRLLDHASAVEAERIAFDSIRPTDASPGATVKACKAYIDAFPSGSQRAAVDTILSQALARSDDEHARAAGTAFATLSDLRDAPHADVSSLIAAAEQFSTTYPSSEHRQTVASWLAAWKRMRAESESRRSLLAVLEEDNVDIDRRVDLVVDHVSAYSGKQFERTNEELVDRILIRPMALPGRLMLSQGMEDGRAAVPTANPAVLALCNLESASRDGEIPLEGPAVLSLSASPDGATAYAGTKSGALLRWTVAKGDVAEVLSLGSALRQVTACADEVVIVSDSTRRGTYAVGLAGGTRITRSLLVGPVGVVRCGAKTPDGRFFALGDDTGLLLLYAIGDEKRPSLKWKTSLGGPAMALAFSNDGGILVASHLRGSVRRTSTWNVRNGAGVRLPAGPKGITRTACGSARARACVHKRW